MTSPILITWMDDLATQSVFISLRKVTFYSGSDNNVANNELRERVLPRGHSTGSLAAANDRGDLSCHQKWIDSTTKRLTLTLSVSEDFDSVTHKFDFNTNDEMRMRE